MKDSTIRLSKSKKLQARRVEKKVSILIDPPSILYGAELMLQASNLMYDSSIVRSTVGKRTLNWPSPLGPVP